MLNLLLSTYSNKMLAYVFLEVVCFLEICSTETGMLFMQYGVKIFLITSFKDTCYMEINPRVQKSKRGKLLKNLGTSLVLPCTREGGGGGRQSDNLLCLSALSPYSTLLCSILGICTLVSFHYLYIGPFSSWFPYQLIHASNFGRHDEFLWSPRRVH